MPAGWSSGYSGMISAGVIPSATRLTINETVSRMPRMQARPPITFGLKVMRSRPIAASVWVASSVARDLRGGV
jgi:hypothetical protein